MDYEIIENPPENWVENLRSGCKVWLVKENTVAEIVFPYESPEPGYSTGYIGLKNNFIDKWHISSNGCGLDGKSLMKPIKGHLPENPIKLPPNDIRHIHYELDHLNKRVRMIESVLEVLIAPLTFADVLYSHIRTYIKGTVE